MNICIRADGGSTIGMGHIVRSVALAEELKNDNHVFFICKTNNTMLDKYKAGIELVEKKGFKVIKVNENNVNKEIINIKSDCIITDSYNVDKEYFDIVKSNFLISGCIFDTDCSEDKIFNVDFFINPDLYATKEMYSTKNCKQMLLGNKYIILRKEFLEIKGYKYEVKSNVKDILIILGGGNSNIYINKILEDVGELTQFKFNVVLGPGFKDKEKLTNKFKKNKNIIFKYNVPDIWNLMKKCDLAISSCSTTLYELMYLGIPTIGVITADNQIVMAEYLKKSSFIKICDLNFIKDTLMKLRCDERKYMSFNSKKFIDGNGVKRIANSIMSLYEDRIKLEDNI